MRVTTTVNGTEHEVDDVWAGESLLYLLRERIGLPGAKNACEQGEGGSWHLSPGGGRAARAPGTWRESRSAPAWSRPARPRVATSSPSRGSPTASGCIPFRRPSSSAAPCSAASARRG